MRNIPGEALALAGRQRALWPQLLCRTERSILDVSEPAGNASPRSPRALWWGRPWRGRAWHVDETCGATVVPVRCECGRGASRMHPSTNFQ
jgi:hypothetical protein